MAKNLLLRGKIWTGCRQRPWAEAALVSAGKFVCVGSWADVKKVAVGAEEADWGSNTILPGMTDAHLHLTGLAKVKLYLNLEHVRSLDEMASELCHYAAGKRPGTWIRAVNYNEMTWVDHCGPTRLWLDSLGLDFPIVLSRYCGHQQVANTLAMKMCGLWDSQDPYVQRGADGFVTGLMIDGGGAPIIEAVAGQYETPERMTQLMKDACLEMSSHGFTAAHACDAPTYGLGEDIYTWQNLAEQGQLPVRVLCWHDRLPNFTFRSGYGDDMVNYAGFKLFCDGALGGHSAALRQPYDDDPATSGNLNHSSEELYNLMKSAQQRDIQVMIHMIGDRAIEQATTCAERLAAEIGKPRRPFRFNHVIVCPKDLRQRLASLGVVLDVQPTQAYTDRTMAPLRLGPKRILDTYPLRDLYGTGLLMVGSTDAPMEQPTPWIGIWTAVCRCNEDGSPLSYDPNQKLTLDEALHLFTDAAWQAIGKADCFGRIEAGYHADFTVIDGDLFSRPAMELLHTRHLATYVEGRKVWQRD